LIGKKARRVFSAGFFCLFFCGCATLSSSINPGIVADGLARKNGFEKILIPTTPFLLNSYLKIKKPGAPLHVYIEGDGLAWFSKTKLSDDPTPRHTLVLNLASEDDADNVAYLARPCQYTSGEDSYCQPVYWSSKRFSEEVIGSMSQAVDKLKELSQAVQIHLIGYSGGGAVAVLVAARRKDVASLRTIAGNLDHEAVNRYHKVSLLMGSLNAVDFARNVSTIPQEHFFGARDKVIPFFIAREFADKAENASCVHITEALTASHDTGWEELWTGYIHKQLDCVNT